MNKGSDIEPKKMNQNKVVPSKTCGCHEEDHHQHEHQSDHNHDHNHDHGREFNLKQEIITISIVVILFLVGLIFETQLHNTPYSIAEYLIFIPAYLLSGWSVLNQAGKNILKGRIFDENFLMTIATLCALAIHKLPEAVGVMLFYRIGELFQETALNRSRSSIKALLEVRPDYANLETNQGLKKVSPETVNLNEIILVKPGEKIPLDGEIIEGQSLVDTAALTGESVPKNLKIGQQVLAGMINQTGVLTIKVTKLFGESSIAKIIDLVQNASSKKAKSQKFITKFAQIYTPIVVILSLLVAILPPLFIPGATHAEWIYRALILLVISCPCGLVISIPLGYFGGVGGAAKKGILVKGATYLDSLAEIKTVLFDKTGTLTQGVFKVISIIPEKEFSQAEILKIAAYAESLSNHPIAQSIRQAYNQAIDPTQVTNYQEISGKGISALVNNQTVLAGNDLLMQVNSIQHPRSDLDGTIVHLAINNQYMGYITIADELKPDAAKAVANLKALGVTKIMMLTGDSKLVAEKIAKTLNLDSYQAELLPEDKLKILETLQVDKHNKIAFVGDGINDAPVIARADVGLAMGGLGSDAAIETADVVIMTDAPSKVAEAIQIARKTKQIVWQNIIFALVIKGLFIILGIFGVANMWEAVFADVGVALLAILNATRVLKA